MALRSTPLPSDPALLTELALALEAENETLRTTIVTLKALIFGARSERFAGLGSEQLALDLLDGRAEETRKTAAGNDDAPPGDPETWLADVLERMVSGATTNDRLTELLAWNWKVAREQAKLAA